MSKIEVVIFTVSALLESPALGGGCCAVSSAWLIEDAIGQLPGIKEVDANDESGEVRVCFDQERIDAKQIGQALQDMGFTPDGRDSKTSEGRSDELLCGVRRKDHDDQRDRKACQ